MNDISLYNSLTKNLEQFEPIDPNLVKIYSCGPTVYNNLHIGNLSAFIYADLLRRTLRLAGYQVKHVMNITDVDDKTIRDSQANYPGLPPKEALKQLTDKYRKVFEQDMAAVGNDLEAIELVSAVDCLPDMIKLIQQIIDAGFAYASNDGIYFSVSKYLAAGKDYGLLQKLNLDLTQSRINNDEYDKDSASDFALWKAEQANEPSWPANFNYNAQQLDMPGRPGWHIECSAMSQKLLGAPFDIHTGGVDLKFPHHENEIAQTCAAGASGLANYFVHNNHILVNGKKMSKSLGNFYTLRDIEAQDFTAQEFRLVVLESHYRSESNFSWDIIQAAKNRLKNWQNVAETSWQLPVGNQEIKQDLLNSMLNDLDTPSVLSLIDRYFDDLEKNGQAPSKQNINDIKDILGIDLQTEDLETNIKQLLLNRDKARQTKDWAASDRLRDQLTQEGIGVKDKPQGQIWFRL